MTQRNEISLLFSSFGLFVRLLSFSPARKEEEEEEMVDVLSLHQAENNDTERNEISLNSSIIAFCLSVYLFLSPSPSSFSSLRTTHSNVLYQGSFIHTQEMKLLFDHAPSKTWAKGNTIITVSAGRMSMEGGREGFRDGFIVYLLVDWLVGFFLRFFLFEHTAPSSPYLACVSL